MRIKAEAFDSDGTITEVRFYINETLVQTVTNAPYAIIKRVTTDDRRFMAIARDDKGVETQSEVVFFPISGAPVTGIVLLEAKQRGFVASGATLEVAAELVAIASQVWTNEILLHLDGQIVGRAKTGPFTPATPPVTYTLTNLAEGEHSISVSVANVDCACPTIAVRAVNLAIRGPIEVLDQQVAFEVVTAFPGRQTVIENSPDLTNWTEARVVTPDQNYYPTTAPIPLGAPSAFFRVRLLDP